MGEMPVRIVDQTMDNAIRIRSPTATYPISAAPEGSDTGSNLGCQRAGMGKHGRPHDARTIEQDGWLHVRGYV